MDLLQPILRAAPTMNSPAAAISSIALVVLAATVCPSTATEWSPEDISNIATAAAESRALETIDVSEHRGKAMNTID